MATTSNIIDSRSERSIRAFTNQSFFDAQGVVRCICGCCGSIGVQMDYKAGTIGYWMRTNTCLKCKQPSYTAGCITEKTQDSDTGQWTLEFKHRLYIPKTRVVVLCSLCVGKAYNQPFVKVSPEVFESRDFNGLRNMVANALTDPLSIGICEEHQSVECDDEVCIALRNEYQQSYGEV
jgi:hypothetical protein